MRMFRACVLGLALGLVAGACSLIVSAEQDELGDRPRACEPGTSRKCPCLPTGSPDGVQRCEVTGGYSSCVCGNAAGSGG